jgi:hypothetical protein
MGSTTSKSYFEDTSRLKEFAAKTVGELSEVCRSFLDACRLAGAQKDDASNRAFMCAEQKLAAAAKSQLPTFRFMACFRHPDQGQKLPYRDLVRKAMPDFPLPTDEEVISPNNEQLALEIFFSIFGQLREVVLAASKPEFLKLFWHDRVEPKQPERNSIFNGFAELGSRNLEDLADYMDHKLMYAICGPVVLILDSLCQARNVRRRVARDTELLEALLGLSYDLAFGCLLVWDRGPPPSSVTARNRLNFAKSLGDVFHRLAMEENGFWVKRLESRCQTGEVPAIFEGHCERPMAKFGTVLFDLAKQKGLNEETKEGLEDLAFNLIYISSPDAVAKFYGGSKLSWMQEPTEAVVKQATQKVRATEAESSPCCDLCGSEARQGERLMRCGHYKVAWYCSRSCQAQAWSAGHKGSCFVVKDS